MPGFLSQTLLIDADDTLWENNIYFEHAIEQFVEFLDHQEYTSNQVREFLYEVERESILQHGYGLHSFAHSLAATFERLSMRRVTPELRDRIAGFAHTIAAQPAELLPGVAETLEYLAPRHRLMMLTKGNFAEQTGKVERSGLRHYFNVVEVVAEKDVPTYAAMISKYGLSAVTTWMVGNSPRSDINPALAVGLNACFVPHAQTWALEQDAPGDPASGRELLVLSCFADLRNYF